MQKASIKSLIRNFKIFEKFTQRRLKFSDLSTRFEKNYLVDYSYLRRKKTVMVIPKSKRISLLILNC